MKIGNNGKPRQKASVLQAIAAKYGHNRRKYKQDRKLAFRPDKIHPGNK